MNRDSTSKKSSTLITGRFLMALAAFSLSPAALATSGKDVKIIFHVFDYVAQPSDSQPRIGILFDGKSLASTNDARFILEALNKENSRRRSAWTAELVDVRELDRIEAPRALVLADQMNVYFDQVEQFARRTKTLLLSSDLDCVRSAKCTIGVASSPRVEIILNAQQAAASHIQFTEAFRMMVTEY